MTLPNGDRAVVPRAKILLYLLAPEHPEGGSKAHFFLSQGYDGRQPELLVDDLSSIARTGSLVETHRTGYGIKYVVDGVVETPDGGWVRLRTVWIVERPEAPPRFVTAYPT